MVCDINDIKLFLFYIRSYCAHKFLIIISSHRWYYTFTLGQVLYFYKLWKNMDINLKSGFVLHYSPFLFMFWNQMHLSTLLVNRDSGSTNIFDCLLSFYVGHIYALVFIHHVTRFEWSYLLILVTVLTFQTILTDDSNRRY